MIRFDCYSHHLLPLGVVVYLIMITEVDFIDRKEKSYPTAVNATSHVTMVQVKMKIIQFLTRDLWEMLEQNRRKVEEVTNELSQVKNQI